jgi:hypothetical protein
MKTYCRSGGMAPRTLHLGTRLKWLPSRSCRSIPGLREPGTHWIRGWMGPRTCQQAVAKRKKNPIVELPWIELRPARSLVTILTELPRSHLFPQNISKFSPEITKEYDNIYFSLRCVIRTKYVGRFQMSVSRGVHPNFLNSGSGLS